VVGRFYIVGLLTLFAARNSPAQLDSLLTERRLYSITGGLGVSMIRVADVVDYINFTFVPDSRISEFAASPEFYIGFDAQVSRTYGLEVEYAYLLRSYNVTQGGLNLTFSYAVHMPALLIHYMYAGKGYILKVGGGAGYHVAIFTQDYLGSVTNYSADGIGMKIAAEGNTAFDDHLFGTIGVAMRGDYLGEFKASKTQLPLTGSNGRNIRMNFVTFGLRLGLAYYF
jgi:hypothetical protein